MRRSLCVLLAVTLALVLVVTLAADADAIKRRRKRGTASFDPSFQPVVNTLTGFDCRKESRPITVDEPHLHGYICAAGATAFVLNDVLDREPNDPRSLPPGPGLPGHRGPGPHPLPLGR